MTDFIFFPQSVQSYNWNNGAAWSTGSAPNSATADVFVAPILQNSSAQAANFTIDLAAGSNIAVGSMQLGGGDTFTIEGSLTASGPLAVYGSTQFLMLGGSATAANWLIATPASSVSSGLIGYGAVTATASFVNHGTIFDNSGKALTISAASFYNDGTITASDTGTVVTVTGGGSTLVNGVLTGGTYAVSDGATLDLSLGGGAITTLAATLELSGSGINTLGSYDSASKSYIPLQSSLTTIAATGLLSVGNAYTGAHALTVNGEIDLSGGSQFNAPSLIIGAGGVVKAEGVNETITVTGGIVNDGIILVAPISQGSTSSSASLVIDGPVSGSGAIELGAPSSSSFLRGNIATASLELKGAAAENVTFLGQYGSLILDQPGSFSGTLTLAGSSDTVQLNGISMAAMTNLAYSDGVLSFQEGGSSYSLHIAGSHVLSDFSLAAGSQQLATSPPSIILSLGAAPGLTVLPMSAAAAQFENNNLPNPVQVQDSASDMQLDTLQSIAAAGKLQSVSVLDPADPINVSFAQLTSDASALAAFTGDYSLALLGATIAQADTVASQAHIAQVAVNDTSTNVAAALDSLQALAASGKLIGISLTDSGSVSLGVTEAQYTADAKAIADITLGAQHGMTVSASAAADAFAIAAHPYISSVSVTDSAAHVSASLDSLEALAKLGLLGGITLTDGSALQLTQAQSTADSDALAKIAGSHSVTIVYGLGSTLDAGSAAGAYQAGSLSGPVTVSDSAAGISANLDGLAQIAAAGQLTALNVTGGTIEATASQIAADSAVLALAPITTVIDVAAGNSPISVAGLANHPTQITFSGAASQYTITPSGDGAGFTVSGNGVTDSFSNVQALKFSDHTEIVATAPSAIGITSGNITELYAAVLDRLPDLPGLSYYEGIMKSNPAIPLTDYATFFLQSPEYTANPAHNYAQTSAGDTQFITDTYTNLLNRGPEAGAVQWYLTNVVNPILAMAQPGSSGYAAAELAAHAAVLKDFSQSTEFLGDVQVTAAHPADANHWLVLI